jgi:hypothetical protein
MVKSSSSCNQAAISRITSSTVEESIRPPAAMARIRRLALAMLLATRLAISGRWIFTATT